LNNNILKGGISFVRFVLSLKVVKPDSVLKQGIVESFEGSADSAGKILQFFVTLAMKESEKPA
jgi:hypothetical protein